MPRNYRLRVGLLEGAPPDVEPEDPDVEFGTPTTRPTVLVEPSATDTGPRQSTTRTLTGSQAIAEAQAAPDRTVRRALITGLHFNDAAHNGLIFEDCVIQGSGGSYTLQSFYNTAAVPTGGNRNTFRYCEIHSSPYNSSAVVVGSYFRLLRCRVHHGIDGIKHFRYTEVYASLVHDVIKSGESHTDTMQIVSGTDNLIHYSSIWGLTAADSVDKPSSTADRALQTGALSNDISNTRYLDNWFRGGVDYCIGIGDTGGPPALTIHGHLLDHWFRRNKFDRLATTAPVTGNKDTNSGAPDGGPRFDSSNVYIDTGLPV